LSLLQEEKIRAIAKTDTNNLTFIIFIIYFEYHSIDILVSGN